MSIWDQYAVAGDENFIPSATTTGATFVWNQNPLFTILYRFMYTLVDVPSSFDTRYGSAVDIRGGCFLAAGIDQQASYGGVVVVDLCRDSCYGCDGILNSCEHADDCGVCLGDNSTCEDCLGVIDGPALEDACDVCQGHNTTCVLPFPVTETIPCKGSFQVQLGHEFQTQWGSGVWRLQAPFATKGTVILISYALSSTCHFVFFSF